MTHVASLADDLVYLAELRGKLPLHIEGKRGVGWILVDFGDVIVNVFDKQSREFYNLDRHFSEENRVDISELVLEVDKKLGVIAD